MENYPKMILNTPAHLELCKFTEKKERQNIRWAIYEQIMVVMHIKQLLF